MSVEEWEAKLKAVKLLCTHGVVEWECHAKECSGGVYVDWTGMAALVAEVEQDLINKLAESLADVLAMASEQAALRAEVARLREVVEHTRAVLVRVGREAMHGDAALSGLALEARSAMFSDLARLNAQIAALAEQPEPRPRRDE